MPPTPPNQATPVKAESASTPTAKPTKKTFPNFTISKQEFVTIIVDKEEIKESFVVHKQLISHYSPFFKAAFESQFIEGQTQTMRLEDVESKIFGKLVHWLHTQQVDEGELLDSLTGLPPTVVPTPVSQSASTGSVTSPASNLAFTNCAVNLTIDPVAMAKLWLLAERCLIPALQDQVMLLLHGSMKLMGPKLSAKFIRYAYKETPSSQILQRLAVCRVVRVAVYAPQVMESWTKSLPHACVVDMANELAKGYGRVIVGESYPGQQVEEFYVRGVEHEGRK